MDYPLLVERLKELARLNPSGFTVTVPDLIPVKRGWSVAIKETQNSFGDEGLKRVLEIALETTQIMGGWDEDNEFWWDAVRIFEDETEATEFGIANDQIAIYCIHLNRPKRLKK